jgi:phosphatidate cytidylyltransferase
MTRAVGGTLGALVGVLAIAEVVLRRVRHRRPAHDYGELTRRVRSWWVIVLATGGALFLGPAGVLVGLALVSYLALKEYFSVVPIRQGDRVVLLVAYLAIPTQWWWIGQHAYGLFIIWVPVYLFIILPSVMVLRGETAGYLHALGTLFWGLMICVFAIGHVAYLYVLPDGAGLLLALLVLTQGNDVAQYLWGRALGRRRIAPTVSPNKTVEGFLGGLLTTTVLAVSVGPLLTPLPWPVALAIGPLVAVSGFLGDLAMSAVKRDLGIKDTGRLIPGHGGVLDRVDSLIFTAPLFFHLVRYVQH